MTKIPVLIAARNEADYIGKTLDMLDPLTVEPLIVVNDSHDDTANIARSTGANVIEINEPGKLLAIQHGLKYLGRSALSPLLLTDADTYPVYPKKWAKHMLSGLRNDRNVASGLYIACEDEPGLNRSVLSALRLANVFAKLLTNTPHASGTNMVMKIESPEMLEELLEMDNFWPGEDLAIMNLVSRGDPARRRTVLDPFAAVRTSSRYLPAVKDILIKGRGATLDAVEEDRVGRRAPDTVKYT